MAEVTQPGFLKRCIGINGSFRGAYISHKVKQMRQTKPITIVEIVAAEAHGYT